ncbi:MAG: tetratricopeptide repeat protein [Acidobacteriia bacterium]|nr:tetratricopeptide repeat protein [Terriglobia bacterium]
MGQDAQNRSSDWTGTQAYVLAVICLLLGTLVGYLLRGSGPAQAAPAGQSAESAAGTMGSQVTPEQLRVMADKQAEPVLGQLKLKPSDPALLMQAGNIYYDAQQFKEAADYYARALEGDPKNTDVRTDMATAYWYLGDADRALAEFDRVLEQQPNKANALLNRGIVRWKGKMDVKGAVADWEGLLKANPDFPQRSNVEQLIAEAKRHSNIKPGEKTSKPAM